MGVNEEQAHTRWLWFHADTEPNCLWKWRKYSVVICQWLSLTVQKFITTKGEERKEVDFEECQKMLEQKHAKTSKKVNRDRDEEKASEVNNGAAAAKKNKKVSIDAYFGKNTQ